MRADDHVPLPDPGGAVVDLYRRAVLYLFAEKAEPLTILDGLNIPGGASAYRGYSAVQFGSPDKAQRAASGKLPGGAIAYRGYSAVQFGSPDKAQCAASGKIPAPPGVQVPYSLANTRRAASMVLLMSSSL
ncbi:hypothetical protein DMR31_11030 [Klebsiella variicola]|nr:hypothetical protein DMQ23_25110 [Klebsiella variicola]PXK29757.1 hypothetical protein DMR31_11030 [Klebsiella variicola]PXK41669.1 hypothetical protein DMR29_22755 [Klebsiella variicola]PXK59599.1 hypothetical protein DMS00_11200 [Klebsiella variicola]PXL50510.1 hypothetical protein DMS63_26810 [Klebsiella variicola]